MSFSEADSIEDVRTPSDLWLPEGDMQKGRSYQTEWTYPSFASLTAIISLGELSTAASCNSDYLSVYNHSIYRIYDTI